MEVTYVSVPTTIYPHWESNGEFEYVGHFVYDPDDPESIVDLQTLHDAAEDPRRVAESIYEIYDVEPGVVLDIEVGPVTYLVEMDDWVEGRPGDRLQPPVPTYPEEIRVMLGEEGGQDVTDYLGDFEWESVSDQLAEQQFIHEV